MESSNPFNNTVDDLDNMDSTLEIIMTAEEINKKGQHKKKIPLGAERYICKSGEHEGKAYWKKPDHYGNGRMFFMWEDPEVEERAEAEFKARKGTTEGEVTASKNVHNLQTMKKQLGLQIENENKLILQKLDEIIARQRKHEDIIETILHQLKELSPSSGVSAYKRPSYDVSNIAKKKKQ